MFKMTFLSKMLEINFVYIIYIYYCSLRRFPLSIHFVSLAHPMLFATILFQERMGNEWKRRCRIEGLLKNVDLALPKPELLEIR